MESGAHAFAEDSRNASVLIYVNGEMKPRAEAMVSVFDSGFLMGDGVWEGLRLHHGRFAFLDRHLDRLYEGAKAIDMDIGMSRQELATALRRTVEANGMETGIHVRLMVTRGLKSTPYQDPRVNIGKATVVIIAEHKQASATVAERGMKLFTVHVRRGAPDVLDPKLNMHSKLNCITAAVQAAKAGADEGLMLDPHGFVATCNSTNFFIVRKGELWTSTGRYCMNGITRANILKVARENGIHTEERDFSLTETYGADEAFVTGTFGGVTPVRELDGRLFGDGTPGPVTCRLRQLYRDLIERECPPPTTV
jgi:branched-chain amino acid aminotransferase